MKRILLFTLMLFIFKEILYPQSFMVDEIQYTVLSKTEYTCGVLSYKSSISKKTIVIPECVEFEEQIYSVISVSDYGFSGINSDSIFLPSTIKEIGERAFENSKILYCELPNSVTYLGKYAFQYCTNLNNIKMSDSLNGIEACVFNGCDNLKAIELSDNIRYINSGAFANCKSLEIFRNSQYIERIEGGAFENCEKLNKILIPETCSLIGEWAFDGCKNLKEISNEQIIPTILNYCRLGVNSILCFLANFANKAFSRASC